MTQLNAITALLALAVALSAAGEAAAQAGRTRLGNICRLKGQEENVLRGIGIVVGLNGTGESNDLATMRALSRSLELMGNPVSGSGRFDEQAQLALKNVKNVALVMVTATVPATGARSGDRLDCTVNAINGKSLAGGRLIAASLQGPNTQDATVYAVCEGPVQISDAKLAMTGYVHGGCQMSRDVYTPFVSDDGWVTLVLDPHHANFNVAEYIAEELGKQYSEDFLPPGMRMETTEVRERYVRAIDAANIRIKVPERYGKDPVAFVSQLLEKAVYEVEPEARVVCDTRNGSVVITGNVEVGDIVFTHKNLVVETNGAPGFQPIANSETSRPKLERLVEALATLRVPAQDVIEIIRGIHKAGRLHAKLVVL